MAQCGGECAAAIEKAVDSLRLEFKEKHRENQVDIRRSHEELQSLESEFRELKGRIEPYLDNGQPGLFSKMSDKLDEVLEKVESLRIDQGKHEERRSVISEFAETYIGPLIVGVLLVLAQHFWK